MEDVLFQITKDQLETGMRGFPVGYCTTSHVDPMKGLFYRGKPISDLSKKKPAEVIHLLSSSQIDEESFRKELCERARLSGAVTKHIEMLPRDGHPMKLFSAALLILGMYECSGNYEEDCLNVIAKLPQLAATVINYHGGFGSTPPSDPSKGYMENFTHMLQIPDKGELAEVFRLFNILHYDHGGGNLSTFTGKAVASGLEDMYGSLSSAMCALAGPRHGKANQDCLEFIQKMLKELGETATPEQVETHIRDILQGGGLIFGFGHAVLRAEDARATIFYDYAQKHFPDHPLVKMALMVRSEGVRVLKENPKIANPYPNVDAMSGTLLTAAGFGYPEYYTVLFGMARSVGIAIQITYERTKARGGKGLPIVRPKYIYKPL